jgi:hypothetical protein
MKIESLSVSYGDRTVFSDFSIDVPEDEITVHPRPIGRRKDDLAELARRRLGFLRFQSPVSFPGNTVERNLSLVLPGDPRAARDRAREYLAKVARRPASLVSRPSVGRGTAASLNRAGIRLSRAPLTDGRAVPVPGPCPPRRSSSISYAPSAPRNTGRRSPLPTTFARRRRSPTAPIVLAGRPARIALDLPAVPGSSRASGKFFRLSPR